MEAGQPNGQCCPTDTEPRWMAGEKLLTEGGGADGSTGEGAKQFHGIFSADVSVVNRARVQFGHLYG